MDAFSTGAAELLRAALVSGWGGTGLHATVFGPLVRTVGAIAVTVAGPQARNTNSVVALKGRGAAGDGRAGSLVTAVVTVCVIVTDKGG